MAVVSCNDLHCVLVKQGRSVKVTIGSGRLLILAFSLSSPTASPSGHGSIHASSARRSSSRSYTYDNHLGLVMKRRCWANAAPLRGVMGHISETYNPRDDRPRTLSKIHHSAWSSKMSRGSEKGGSDVVMMVTVMASILSEGRPGVVSCQIWK